MRKQSSTAHSAPSAANRLTSQATGQGYRHRTKYGYDVAERLTNVTSPAGVFGYLLGGSAAPSRLPNKLALPNGAYITNYYDSVARLLSTVLKNNANAVLNSHAYGYNVAGQRIWLTNTAGDFRNYGYDNIGQLTSALGSEASGATRWHEQLRYAYDAAGNLNSRVNNDLVQTFNVNNLNELTTVSRTTNMTVVGTTTSIATNVTLNNLAAILYADATFARTNIGLVSGTNTFTAIAADSLGRKDTNSAICNLPSTISYSYDANGNLLNDGSRYFTYDDENQLISVILTNNGSMSTRSDFVYDGKMRRRIRVEYTWGGTFWVTNQVVRYVYDGNLTVQERDANNLPSVSYTRGNDLSGTLQGAGGIGGLLARTDHRILATGDSQAQAYYEADGNGNISALITGEQTIVAKYIYDAYGNTLSVSGPSASNNVYRFSSEEYHSASGLLAYLFRFYDSGPQRWLTRDPIGEAGGVDTYTFVLNIPTSQVDPLGLGTDEQMINKALYGNPHPEPVEDTTPAVQWAPEKCKCGNETRFIQVVTGGGPLLRIAAANPLVDDGSLGYGRGLFYPHGGPGIFVDQPSWQISSPQFEVCRVCVDATSGKIVSVGPCKQWTLKSVDQNLSNPSYQTTPFPSPGFTDTVNKYMGRRGLGALPPMIPPDKLQTRPAG